MVVSVLASQSYYSVFGAKFYDFHAVKIGQHSSGVLAHADGRGVTRRRYTNVFYDRPRPYLFYKKVRLAIVLLSHFNQI